jgi:hypothetical protein
VRVVFPASGWLMMAKVRRLAVSVRSSGGSSWLMVVSGRASYHSPPQGTTQTHSANTLTPEDPMDPEEGNTQGSTMIRAMPTRHGESLEHIDSKRNRYERVHGVHGGSQSKAFFGEPYTARQTPLHLHRRHAHRHIRAFPGGADHQIGFFVLFLRRTP